MQNFFLRSVAVYVVDFEGNLASKEDYLRTIQQRKQKSLKNSSFDFFIAFEVKQMHF